MAHSLVRKQCAMACVSYGVEIGCEQFVSAVRGREELGTYVVVCRRFPRARWCCSRAPTRSLCGSALSLLKESRKSYLHRIHRWWRRGRRRGGRLGHVTTHAACAECVRGNGGPPALASRCCPSGSGCPRVSALSGAPGTFAFELLRAL